MTPDGPRPGGAPPSPSNPDDRPPKRLAVDDPAKLARAGHILQVALARQGLTVADLQAPEAGVVRAA